MPEPLTELLSNIFVISDHTDEKEVNTLINVRDFALCLKILRENKK